MDAIHYHDRSEGRIIKRAVCIALGIDMNGKKDVLGMYVGENESAKFWLSIMNGLKNRGVEDILIACVDGLSGFLQAIEAVYPQTEIHQIRNSTKFVSYKDIKKHNGRSKACICCTYRGNGIKWAGTVQRQLGFQISENI